MPMRTACRATFFQFVIYVEQYKAEVPYREDSELSLKKAKREQTEEEAGSHRGPCATEPPKEGSGSFFFALAVCAIFAPVVLGLGPLFFFVSGACLN